MHKIHMKAVQRSCHKGLKNVSNGRLWLKYRRLYGLTYAEDQEFDINLTKFVQCMCNLLNKDS